MVVGESAAHEMLRVKMRIEQLENLLALSSSVAPEGTEDLAQGDDEIEIGFRFRYTMDLVGEKRTLFQQPGAICSEW